MSVDTDVNEGGRLTVVEVVVLVLDVSEMVVVTAAPLIKQEHALEILEGG
jgi:hypothetical protein